MAKMTTDKLTEDQIERHVESAVNRYDAAFMVGRIDQQAYDSCMRDLNIWADNQYSLATAIKLKLGASNDGS